MGFSVTAASAILFAAALISLGTLLSGYSAMQSDLSEGNHLVNERLREVKGESIAIIGVDVSNGTIEVENTGSAVFSLIDVDVLANGTLINPDLLQATVQGAAGSSIWAPNEKLIITLDTEIIRSKLAVIVGSSAAAYWG
jgi:archaellum component FlaF (FlaF/FlaG flagellin family)